jgi:hypothetical protein
LGFPTNRSFSSSQPKQSTRRLINYLELSQASKHHLQSFGFFPFGPINLGFLLRENLAAIFIIPCSWGSQLDGALHYHTVPHQSLTGKLRELVDTVVRRSLDILCVQETKWRGQKVKEVEDIGFKLWYTGTEATKMG